jgi:hypothetical protein
MCSKKWPFGFCSPKWNSPVLGIGGWQLFGAVFMATTHRESITSGEVTAEYREGHPEQNPIQNLIETTATRPTTV